MGCHERKRDKHWSRKTWRGNPNRKGDYCKSCFCEKSMNMDDARRACRTALCQKTSVVSVDNKEESWELDVEDNESGNKHAPNKHFQAPRAWDCTLLSQFLHVTNYVKRQNPNSSESFQHSCTHGMPPDLL